MRVRFFGAVATAVLLTATSSSADVKDECIDAHTRAQRLRNAGHLKAEREALLACSRDECPPLVLADCRPWINTNREEEPSIVLNVHDEHGIETSEVRLLIDGEIVGDRLDGRPIDVDPGEHVLRFERPNCVPLEQRILLRVGEHERLVSVAFPSVPKVEASQRSRWSAAALVSGAIGIVGVGAFAAFGISGKIEESNLADTCRPNCSEDRIDDVRTKYVVAYASLGVGVVALGVSIGLLATAPTRRSLALQWSVAPVLGGAATTLLGRF